MKESEVAAVQSELRIIYGIDNDGQQVVSTTYCTDGEDDATPDYFTGIVMLETAKIDFLHRHGVMCSRDDHDEP